MQEHQQRATDIRRRFNGCCNLNIPHGTRSRPILHVTSKGKGIPVFPIISTVLDFFMQLHSRLTRGIPSECCYVHDVSSYKVAEKLFQLCGFDISSATASFWSEDHDVAPLLTVEVYIPSHWSPSHFLLLSLKIQS
jgi:hypothetical protein